VNYNLNTNPSTGELEEIKISSQEMKELLTAANNLFQILCFRIYQHLWLWDYTEAKRESNTLDIDALFDSVVEKVIYSKCRKMTLIFG
jgi:hypothetical protein